MLKDSLAREQATDPGNSYIVQAPAGSGKTELLTQRYLRLLSCVNAPEQIIALTFTRKAASEMRERILSALHKAKQGVSPLNAHQELTLKYAKEALELDAKMNWQLLQHPTRLRIMTIDSLCQHLVHAIPLTEQAIPYAEISESPEHLYSLAAHNCLNEAIADPTLSMHLEKLLDHLDNRQDRLIALFCNLLTTREQWVRPLLSAREQTRAICEEALQQIVEHELKRLHQSLPKELWFEINRLTQWLFELTTANYPDSFKNWSPDKPASRDVAQFLSSLLLTKSNSLRRSFDQHVGLKSTSCSKQEYQNIKRESSNLFQQLQEQEEFLSLLPKLQNLPPPFYHDSQWQIVQCLLSLLPRLIAHLYLVFNEQTKVDFSAISQSALYALGDEQNPSDLSLYLDHTIHHLLIDEFQDTSILQYHLLQQLVQSWHQGDGKTLFIVGDPMQSIYRFRQAEVGLFLRAMREGIGPVNLHFLQLTSNFRSTQELVDWINNQFTRIFPTQNDIESGAICFHPAQPTRNRQSDSTISAYYCEEKSTAAAAIVQIIKNELSQYPNDNIALLVRSRTQLKEIIPLLRAHKIDFQGVDIEQLTHLPHIQDLWTLTKALLMPADRLAWLALLRTPYCGLCLSDIHIIAQKDRKKSIFELLQEIGLSTEVSEEGRSRVLLFTPILAQAIIDRHQSQLVKWIQTTLRNLKANLILTKEQQQDLEQFWHLLQQYDHHGLIQNKTLFEEKINSLYSQQSKTSRLQIMTIHKSKGLEFDCVLLPGLSSRASQRDRPLLRWLQLPTSGGHDLMLISPIQAAHEQQSPLYNYLGELDAEKEFYEQQRLLYVATTRAKKRVYLLDHQEKPSANSFRSLLITQPFTAYEAKENPLITQSVSELWRLPLSYYQVEETKQTKLNDLPPLQDSLLARHLGTTAHLLLQWLSENHIQREEEVPWLLAANQLKYLGLSPVKIEKALQTIKNWISTYLQNPIGQWINKQHLDEMNELSLLVEEETNLSSKIIDRTFSENGVRWIIDFKTGNDDEYSFAEHQQQVNNYAKHFQAISSTISCGLFYLATNRWVTWHYQDEKISQETADLMV